MHEGEMMSSTCDADILDISLFIHVLPRPPWLPTQGPVEDEYTVGLKTLRFVHGREKHALAVGAIIGEYSVQPCLDICHRGAAFTQNIDSVGLVINHRGPCVELHLQESSPFSSRPYVECFTEGRYGHPGVAFGHFRDDR